MGDDRSLSAGRRSTQLVEPGERMLLWCDGGPSASRLVRFPPPVEITERGGTYVLVDDGPPEHWWYLFVPYEGGPA